MVDAFLKFERPAVRYGSDRSKGVAGLIGAGHAERAHSKFSASGAERWFNCPGSVELSEGMPDKSSPWAEEGTRAHEVLEAMMRVVLGNGSGGDIDLKGVPHEMILHSKNAAQFIFNLADSIPRSEVLVETRIRLDFIHPEMFGTFDGAVIDYFGTLHVFDYKYGAGHMVSVRENLQMIFYAIGLAHLYQWNFKMVRMWIIQPRIKGYDGPTFWDVPILKLKSYVAHFRTAVETVLRNEEIYVEGSWCHWCKAKAVCPLKRQAKLNEARFVFQISPFRKMISDG